MPSPRVIILRAPGTNCDVETAWAFDRAGASAERIHLFRLLERPAVLRDFQLLCIPGGFSFGDDVGAGVIMGAQLRSRLAGALGEFLQADRLVLGICNGFQVLMKSGILPGGSAEWPPSAETVRSATLTWNDNGRYTATWVRLSGAGSSSPFLKGIDEIELPVAHAEGKIVVREPAVLDAWRKQRQIALRYVGGTNPNGSTDDIAAVCDPSGRVLGLMPHPERHIFATQHPQWTRRRQETDEGPGMRLFRNAVEYFQ
jgi:phosphoribosylformylglycinamidine synthase subunit PurQ / glutaminase